MSNAVELRPVANMLGDGKFIDATTAVTPMVRIDDLNEPRWTRLLVAMRRVK